MGPDVIFDVLREALVTVAEVAAPFLIAGLIVGVVMAILQAATQVQEQSLSFVPKLIVLGLILSIAGPALLERLTTFSKTTISRISDVGRRGS